MKLQSLTVIFIIIIIPVILIVSLYISTGLKTIKLQSEYDSGLIDATHDAIYAFELNTSANKYANNPEIKRDILKASVKMFEKSLCNTCNISSYNKNEIEKYIPAIVFGMYDGFYVYAPSKTLEGKYEHGLKNYVYYSETLDNGIVIRYSLDNYVSVSGYLKENPDNPSEKSYITKEGYLTTLGNTNPGGSQYNGCIISDEEAKEYYSNAWDFTYWLYNQDGIPDYLKTDNQEKNDPENENSPFALHKKEIIKTKMESVLNSYITAYKNRLGNYNYKMPKLSVEDWEKIYSNISMITFFQGKNIGLTRYNGYCVLNSTNSNEYVNPNLMYFIKGDDDINYYYHDIRCTDIASVDNSEDLKGYKIGAYQKEKLKEQDENGNYYKYNHNALACYDCINGSISTSQSVYDYVRDANTDDKIKTAYYTSLAKERYNQIHLLKTEN